MADEEEVLSAEYDAKMRRLECSILLLNFREKSIATEWITKLKAANTTIEEKRVRNDFLVYLVDVSGTGSLCQEPFNNIPPSSPLLSLTHLLPKEYKIRSVKNTSKDKSPKVEEMFSDATDKGHFLSQQPVPNNGSFCFIIIKKS